jgi:hypothetical protein
MRLPLRQEKTHSGAENKAGHREPNSCLNSVCGDDVRMRTGPSAKPTMPPAVKRPIPRVAFVACEPAIVVPMG